MSSFLSPLTDRRTDDWGGSREKRARLILSIVRSVREAVGSDFGVAVKLNSANFQRGGFDIDGSVQVAGWLDAAGIDLLEVSGGNNEAPRKAGIKHQEGGAQAATKAREAYFREFAPGNRASLIHAKLMVTSGFRSAAAMDEALSQDGGDLIGLARPLCAARGAPEDLLPAA